MALNRKKIINKEVTIDKESGHVVVTIFLSERQSGEIRTTADHRDAAKIAEEEGVQVGKLITDCRINNRSGPVTGTWEFYQSYTEKKPVKIEKVIPTKKEEPVEKKAPVKKEVKKEIPVKKEAPVKKVEPKKEEPSSGFFAKREKKKGNK